MKITKIEVSRLYNLGNFENITYSLEADIEEGDDPNACYSVIEEILDKKAEDYRKTKGK